MVNLYIQLNIMHKKKFTQIFNYFLIIFFITFSNVKATEECFEGFSRAIFKFNMAFDETIFEPVAKGYNKLPNPIAKEQAIYSISMFFYSKYYFRNLRSLVMRLAV